VAPVGNVAFLAVGAAQPLARIAIINVSAANLM
jgi:hypothetical protein